ncbi:Protein yippee-like [Sparassis crispa]|uniref:Protein yippee-like n=1 Tax=Sparassis crispa TaxID=139825 RepID=A0A401H4D0_9APHY|nr:Protein yippee-like [Sparassis crispa]GBE89288.1 Protein yippee-like [Sparassis crispa]
MPDFALAPVYEEGNYSSSHAVQCTLTCKTCHSSIASQDCLLSTAFRGHTGKAALYSEVSNVTFNAPCILLMNTGAHTVQELSCKKCTAYLGWKIVRAHEKPEKWKEGHHLLELALLEEVAVQSLPGEMQQQLDTVVSRFAASLDFGGSQPRRASSPDPYSYSQRGKPLGPRIQRSSLSSLTRSSATL